MRWAKGPPMFTTLQIALLDEPSPDAEKGAIFNIFRIIYPSPSSWRQLLTSIMFTIADTNALDSKILL